MRAPARRALATLASLGAIALALAGAAAAQTPAPTTPRPMTLQDVLDEAEPGSTVHVPAGKHVGPFRVTKPIVLVGARDHASVLVGPHAAPAARETALLVDAPGVVLDGLAFADCEIAIQVAGASRVDVLGARFRNVTLPVLAQDRAIVLVADAGEAVRAEARFGARVYHGAVAEVRVVENGTREPVSNATLTLAQPDGAPVADWRADAAGAARIIVPRSVTRAEPLLGAPADGTQPARASAVEPVRLQIVASAAGYRETRILASEAVPVATIELSAIPSPVLPASGGLDAARAWWSGATPATRAAVAAGASVGALGAGAAVALRNENRLLRFLFAILPLYTRLVRARLLDQPTRERVFAFVKENPGSHYREIRRALDLPNGVLVHHLDVLVREGFVRAQRDGMYRRFYPAGSLVPPAAPVADTSERVLAFVRANPGATGSSVARALAASPSLVSYHVDRLEATGRLARAREGREVRLYPLDRIER